ncbi:serine/threonine-protein kinase [Novosphingobium piscinae]|uniref:Serine/threonine protein kinase n=2 Tax=Novosphingobium piscinae TaxID=1507448 RepID=A0A7X1KQ97_9SPHN|nr:serine/threonine-protein kinase [Novosphingobium piscinae]MBC2669552.1 serine/threonine protein kinase [Novosphingobium piscinae]
MKLFETALDWPPPARRERLSALLASEPEVLAAVLAMLEADAAAALLPTLPPAPIALVDDAPSPTRIGSYRIIEEIGRGGMGLVYRAARDDGLFDQEVAIKVIRRTIFSDATLAQFATERRILARLHHPHIAHLLDGGVSADGSPYIIMELIRGAPITDHATRRGLALAERLALFRDACTALEHAHRELVVHADVKPSNVVVAEGFGVKLLDFGIARLVGDESTLPGMAHTPGYSSPARQSGARATPSDDVYALGVLLGQLIAGVDGVNEDLRAVASRAAAPEPSARYGAVSELIAELDRWQRHEPVQARPPGRLRAGAMVLRRNRALAVGIALLALTASVTSVLYIRAEQAQAQAEHRFAEVRSLARYMLYDQFDGLARVPGTLKVRLALLDKSQAYLNSLAADRTPSADLALDIGQGFTRLAVVQAGRRGGPNLQLSKLAGQNLARADAVLGDALQRFPDRADIRMALAALRAQRCARSIYTEHGVEAAIRFAQSAEDLLAAMPGAAARDVVWTARDCRADAYTWLNQPKQAIALLTSEIAAARARMEHRQMTDDLVRELGLAYRLLAEAAFYDNDFAQSAAHGTTAVGVLRPLIVKHPDTLTFVRAYVAALMITAQASTNVPRDYGRALALLTEGSRLYRRMVQRDPEDTGTFVNLLSLEGDRAMVLAAAGRGADALALSADITRMNDDLARRYPDDLTIARNRARALATRVELLARTSGKAAGCQGTRAALAAWQAYGRQFGLTASDRADIVDPLDKALLSCP